jgi:prephenate dehydrogenase
VTPDDDFQRIAIVGLGLIGGSIAFAARRTFPSAVIIGVDVDDVIVPARQLGAVTHGSTELEIVKGADLVILAAPVRENVRLLARLATLLEAPTVITDTGSTKRAIVEQQPRLADGVAFVGGHPLAGAARGGIEASRVDLFERRAWVLTPTAATPPAAVDCVSSFVRALGAQPLVLDASAHDRVLAYTSHLPQLTASALMHVVGQSVGDAGLRLAGGGLADTTRVAASPSRIWTDICATNADEILPALDGLIDVLQRIRRDLVEDRSIEPLFESAQRWRGRIK